MGGELGLLCAGLLWQAIARQRVKLQAIWKRCCHVADEEEKSRNRAELFMELPSYQELPIYYELIARPMDLKMASALRRAPLSPPPLPAPLVTRRHHHTTTPLSPRHHHHAMPRRRRRHAASPRRVTTPRHHAASLRRVR